MNDRDTHYDDDPLKNHSSAYKVSVRIGIGLLILAAIVFLILVLPLAWDQTYGSPG